MDMLDLLAMRESYTQQRIMLCFNGPISRSLIEEIGNALRNYLAAEQAQPSAAMDVFAVYIEMTQNIRHYALQQGYGEQDASATVAIARDEQGHYQVSAGNLVERADGERLLQIVEGLGRLDKVQLKAAYKEQLRKPREAGSASGAGLGLLDIARKSSVPLVASKVKSLPYFSRLLPIDFICGEGWVRAYPPRPVIGRMPHSQALSKASLSSPKWVINLEAVLPSARSNAAKICSGRVFGSPCASLLAAALSKMRSAAGVKSAGESRTVIPRPICSCI